MYRTIRTALAVVFPVVVLVACGGGGAPVPERPAVQASARAPQPAQEPTPVAAAPAASPKPTPAPPAAKAAVRDPGGPVEVAPTVEGAARIGAANCKVCHKIQYVSWSGSAHAKRNPPLDCEACHGPGSAYKTIAVMKDPAKARAAGLVMPAKAFCASCHKEGWTDAMLTAVHAHKPK